LAKIKNAIEAHEGLRRLKLVFKHFTSKSVKLEQGKKRAVLDGSITYGHLLMDIPPFALKVSYSQAARDLTKCADQGDHDPVINIHTTLGTKAKNRAPEHADKMGQERGQNERLEVRKVSGGRLDT
jgi:hypothetical protein